MASMPAKPSKKKPDTPKQKKQKKKSIIPQEKPKKLPRKTRKMLRRQQREWAANRPQSHLRWCADTASSNWCEDTVNFNCNGLNFEQQPQPSQQHNKWLMHGWMKNDFQYDSSRLGHQHWCADNQVSEQRRQPDPTKSWSARPQCDTAHVRLHDNYSSLTSLQENNRIPHRTQSVPLHSCPAVERPTSPSGGSKLNMSLKTSINNILKGGSVCVGKEQVDLEGDRGEALLQRAENMCRQFRESREHAKKEQENRKKLERSALDEQVVSYGERTRLKARGVLPEKAPVSSLAGTPSWGRTHIRYREDSCHSASVMISSGASDESRSQVRSVRDEPHLTVQKHSVPVGITRVQRNSGESLNRDRISKLVNAPRSRKERLQLEKILQSHKPSGRPVVRPKLHLETTAAVSAEGELDFSELPGDILQQIEMLIQTENDRESEGVVHLDSDILNPLDVDGALTASNVNDALRIEDLYSTPVRSSHSDTVYTSVASTSRSGLDTSVTYRRATGDTVSTVTKGACRTVAADTTETAVNATFRYKQSLMSQLDHTGVMSTSPLQPASTSVQPTSTHKPVCSAGKVHIKTESADTDDCVICSTPPSNSLPPFTMEEGHTGGHHNVKGPEKESGVVSVDSPHVEKASDSSRSALTLDVGIDAATGQIQGQTQGQDGSDQDVPETWTETELNESGGKRRSRISTCVSKEAKRQKVNSTGAHTTHDMSISMDAPSTGEQTLARVLVISLRENQVISKLTGTGAAIEKLEKLLKETREQLNRRLTMKQELLDEQESLREERLKILSEHKMLATSTREPVETDISTRPPTQVPENVSFAFSAGTTVGGDGKVIQSQSTLSTNSPQLQHESVSVVLKQLNVSHSVGSSPDSTKHGQTIKEDLQEMEEIKPRIRRKKSASFCVADSDTVGCIDMTTSEKTVKMSSGVCLNYVGTLEGQGIEAEPFLNHVASMSPFVFLEPLPGHWVTSDSGSSQVVNAAEETQHKSPEPEKVKSTAENGAKPAERRSRIRRNSSNKVSSDSTAPKEDVWFKKPKPVFVVRCKNTAADKKYEKFKQSVIRPCNWKQKTKSKTHKKVSEVYPGPDANVHKKLKSKKARKPSSSVAVRDSSVDSNSDCTGQPDMSVSSASVKQSGKKRPNKRCTDPISKAVQQYLHAESSSDVEITGLQTPAKASTQSCQSVLDDSSVDDTSSVSSTATQQSMQVGSAPDDISLSSSDNSSKVKQKRAMSTGCFEGHEGPVRCIYLYRGFLFTGSEDGTVRQFKLRSRQHRCSTVYRGHTQGVSCIHVSDYGNEGIRVFTGSYDGNMLVFRYRSGVQLFAHHYGVQVNTMHANWNRLFLGLGNGAVVKYDFQEYRNGPAMACADSGITCLASAMEGARKLLCVASNDCVISVRDAITGLLIHMLNGHTKTPLCMYVLNHIVYSGGTDKSVQVYNLNTAELLKTLRFRAVVNCIGVRGHMLFIASYDGTVRCYDTQTYKLKKIYYGAGKAAVMAMVIRGNLIFTGNREGFCEVVEMTDDVFKCEYGGCDLVYATKQYLHHHVITEHTNNITKNALCQWINCNTYLHWSRNQEAAIKHTSSHILDK